MDLGIQCPLGLSWFHPAGQLNSLPLHKGKQGENMENMMEGVYWVYVERAW